MVPSVPRGDTCTRGSRACRGPFRPTGPPSQVPPPRACNCTDVYPHVGYNAGVVSSCLEMQRYKKCGEPFMMNAIKELPEGYCQVTCGRCSCCKPLWDTMQGMSDLSMFRDYASAVGLTDDLKNPGIMWTVLAPTNPGERCLSSWDRDRPAQLPAPADV